MQTVDGGHNVTSHAEINVHTLPFFPDQQVHIGLFTDLKNAPYLRQQLLAGNSAFEYGFIDATAIVSTRHVLAACFRAINDMLNGRLRSRNVHSEIVYSLNANNNITDSFRHFGISDTTCSLVAVKVTTAPQPGTPPTTDIVRHLKDNVEGTLLPFTDDAFLPLTDLQKVKKLYKLNSTGPGNKPSKKKTPKPEGADEPGVDSTGQSANARNDRAEIEAVILGVMAMKGS